MKKTISGFTIVELLIVIVVIAVLVAISVAAYSGVQIRSRDSARLNDVAVIQKALEYYKSINSTYPEENRAEVEVGSIVQVLASWSI